MSAARAGAATGLVITAVVAVWWLASVRFSPLRAGAAAEAAAQAVVALWLVRAVSLTVFAARLGVLLAPRRGAAANAALVAVAWPLLVLLWAARGMPASAILAGEAALLVLAATGLAGGWAMSRLPVARGLSLGFATAVSGVGAALLLVFHKEYLPWLGLAA